VTGFRISGSLNFGKGTSSFWLVMLLGILARLDGPWCPA
jgi:hypothetical protein